MPQLEASRLFGGQVGPQRVLIHDWQGELSDVGEIAAAEVAAVSGGRLDQPIPVGVSSRLLDGWDLVVSLGQVVPHEVAGMSNYTKNLIVGLGGQATIGATHWLGALCGMETIMGRTHTPVRDVLDAAFERLLAPTLEVLWILTVMESAGGTVLQRGLFAGDGRPGGSGAAAFRAAAGLSAECNITTLADRQDHVACWLDPGTYRSTWLANKAVYRTRMALADDGELVVLAPGVTRFGEDPLTDRDSSAPTDTAAGKPLSKPSPVTLSSRPTWALPLTSFTAAVTGASGSSTAPTLPAAACRRRR